MTAPFSLDGFATTVSEYVDGRLSILQLCEYADGLWKEVASDVDRPRALEEENLLWAVASALQATCLVEAYDHNVEEIDKGAVLAVIEELLIYLDEGEDAWRRKVQAGWWPW